MRALPAALALLALALVPAGTAQLPSPILQVTVQAPSEPLPPGGQAGLVLHLERTCPNQAAVLDSQQVDIVFGAPDGAAVDGPAQATFPGQTCANQPRAELDVEYVVHAPATAAGRAENATSNAAGNASAAVLSFQVRVRGEPTSPLYPSGQEVASAFTIAVLQPEPAAAATQPVEQAAPSPALAFVGLALLAAAVALRRRA
jgi:MYXO-CTERM domain-containing protein